MKKIQKLIVWIRRELRMEDHLALWSAIEDAVEVIPLFIVDGEFHRLAPARQKVVIDALKELRASLRSAGGELFVRAGEPVQVLHRLLDDSNVAGVYVTKEYQPGVRDRDRKLQASIEQSGKLWREFKGHVIFEGEEIVTAAGRSPFRVFSPYRNAWRARLHDIAPPLPRPKQMTTPEGEAGRIPALPSDGRSSGTDNCPVGGEREARKQTERFLSQNVRAYHERRDFPGQEGTSRLSHHLATGTISIRTVYHAVKESCQSARGVWKQGADAFLNELIWREFYYQILANYPHVATGSFKAEYDRLPWARNDERLDAWRCGCTGYPIVDAAMRQLVSEGWMHNRSRMVVANFLVKDLHLNWQTGEEFFMEHLADGDPALNNGGWQWCAGTGTDAQPWFRILNPTLQSKRFDPRGKYLKRYLPELRNVPDPYLHEPWLMPRPVQERAGCFIGRHYPAPIVDHERERKRTLEIYSTITRSSSTRHRGDAAPVGIPS